MDAKEKRERQEVEDFRSFLRIETESFAGPTTGAYAAAVRWLRERCDAIPGGVVRTQVIECVPGKPVLIATLEGRQPELPSVLLNGHYDVVPADVSRWTRDPWGAERTADGRIYGRGAQDMKSVCCQYLAALARLMKARNGEPFRRTVHLTFVPDEENGGADGMGKLARTDAFRALDVGVALDEGLANPDDAWTVFYAERQPWWVLFRAQGPTGHGSRFIPGTAASQIVSVANRALAFRREQEELLGHTGGCAHAQAKKLGDVTTLNLTMLRAGVETTGEAGAGGRTTTTYALNCVPTEAEAGFDVRITPAMPLEDVRAMLNRWAEEASREAGGDGTTVTWDFAPWTTPMQEHHATDIFHNTTGEEEEENEREDAAAGRRWWEVLRGHLESLGKRVEPEIFPAATDSRFLRALGFPAFGFSPMANTPVLLHEHDEYLDERVFLEGIVVYESLIPALAENAETSSRSL